MKNLLFKVNINIFFKDFEENGKDVEENGVFSEKKLKTPQKEIYKVVFFFILIGCFKIIA